MRALQGLFQALVARHAKRHVARVALTVASVAVGVAVVVAVSIADRNAVESFASSAGFVSGDAAIEVTTDGLGLPDALISRLSHVAGVARASGIIEGAVTDVPSRGGYDLLGLDMVEAAGAGGDQSANGIAKASFSPRIFERGAVVVSQALAQRLHARLGSDILILAGVSRIRLFIAGIIDDAAMPIGSRGTMFCDLSTAQETLGKIGRVDRIEVVPQAGVDVATVSRAIAAVIPHGARVEPPSERVATIAKMTDAFRFNLAALAAIALLVAAYLVFNAVSMSVVQRRPEIGIARAVGATRGAIFAIFLLEGAAVGVAGSVLGMLLGLALADASLRVVAGTIDQLYAGTPVFGWSAAPIVYLQAAGVGIGTSLAASLLPAAEAASVEPSIAVRVGSWERTAPVSTRALTFGAAVAFVLALLFARIGPVDGRPIFAYVAGIAVIVGCSFLAAPLVSVSARLARSLLPAAAGAPLRLAPVNLRARVRRNAVAVASLMIAVAMTVSVSTMIASFRDSVETWLAQTLRGDLFVQPAAAVNADDVRMPDSIAGVARRIDDVAAIDVVRAKLIEVAGRPAYVGASDMRVTSVRGYLPLIDGGDWRSVGPMLIGHDDALVSEPFSRKFGARRGSDVVVQGSSGPATLHVIGVYEDYSSDTGYLFVDIGTYRAIFGDDGINGFAVYARPGSDVGRLRARLQSVLARDNVDVRTNAQLRTDALEQFDRTFAVTSVLDTIAVAVALMGVIATLASLVLERRREIGVLRCLGMLRRQVSAMIVAEATLLGVMGSALGIAAGYALAAILIDVVNPQAFGWTISFLPTPLFDAAVVAGVTLVAAFAGLLVAVQGARIDVADAVRAE